MPPMIRTAATPPRIHHRYLFSGSGASIGGPSPPPGRLFDSTDGVAVRVDLCSPRTDSLELCCWPVSCALSPEILKARFCPAVMFDATRTVALGWLGKFSNLKGAELADALNCIPFGNVTTKCSKG